MIDTELKTFLARYVDAETAAKIVENLWANVAERLKGYDSSKQLRPYLFHLVLADAMAMRPPLSEDDRAALQAMESVVPLAAERLGLPIGTFKVRLRRAYRKLAIA